MPSQPDLRKLWYEAKILTMDGQEIAKGAIRLEVAPAPGTFLPNPPQFRFSDIPRGSKLVAEIGTNQFELANWQLCEAPVEVDALGHCHVGPHYHFECEA
jgi:hypothetical protein